VSVRILLTCRLRTTNQHDFASCLAASSGVDLYVLTESPSHPDVPGLDSDRIYHFHPTWPVIFSRLHPHDRGVYEDILDDIDPDVLVSTAISHLVFMGPTADFSPTVVLPQGGLVNRSTRKRCKRRNFGPRWLMYRPLVWDLFRHVDEAWAPEPGRELLAKLGLEPWKFRGFDWGPVDTSKFTPQEGVSFDVPEEKTIIGSFRRIRNPPLIPSYRAFFEAVDRLREQRTDFHVVLGGYYPDDRGTEVEEAIDDSIQRHGLDEFVTKLGMVDKTEMPRYYSGLDVYVNFSPTGTVPGIGTASKEAMACERPFVTFDDPPTGWIIDHDENGLRFDHDDTAALADSLADLCADPGYRQELGAAARETVLDNFSFEAVNSRAEAYCRRLAATTR